MKIEKKTLTNNMKLQGFFLLILLICFTQSKAYAEDYSGIVLENNQDDILNVLLTSDFANATDKELFASAEKAVDFHLPYLAEEFLSHLKQQQTSADSIYLDILIAIEKHDVTKPDKLTKDLLAALKQKLPIDKQLWDKRLNRIFKWYRKQNYLDNNKDLINDFRKQFPDLPAFNTEHMIWRSYFEQEYEVLNEALSLLDNCTKFNECLAPIEFLNHCNLPIQSRYYFYKSWKLAKSKEDFMQLLKTAILIADSIDANKILASILTRNLSVEDFTNLLVLMPFKQEEILKKLFAHAAEKPAIITSVLELLWEMKAYKQIKSILPPLAEDEAKPEQKGNNSEQTEDKKAKKDTADLDKKKKVTLDKILPVSLASYKFLSKVANSNVFGKDQQYYKAMLQDLTNKILSTNISDKDKKFLLLYTRPAKGDKVSQKVISEYLDELSKAEKFSDVVILFKYYLLSGNKNKSQIQFSTLVNKFKNKAQLLNEIMFLFHKLKLLNNNKSIQSQWFGRLNNVSNKTDYLEVAQNAAIYKELNKTRESQAIVMKAANSGFNTLQQIELANISATGFNGRQFTNFASGIKTNENTDERFLLLSLYFRLDLHEQALAMFYKLNSENNNPASLIFAKRLLLDYISFKVSLKHSRRKTIVSLDIYTQLIVKILNGYLENAKPVNWPQLFSILQNLQTSPEYNSAIMDRNLRKAFYDINQDVDATLFEFYSRFTKEKQPFEKWIAIASVLAKNQNPDFFSVIWEKIKAINSDNNNIFKLDGNSLKNLLYSLLSNNRKEYEKLFTTLCDKWQAILTKQENSNELSHAALILSAIFNYQTEIYNIAKTFLNQNLAAIDKNISELEKLESSEDLPFRKARILLTEDIETHDLSAKEIHSQTLRYDWYFADCLSYQTIIKDDYTAFAEITTDSDGKVTNVSLRSFPAGFDEERKCLENKFTGFVYDNIEPPFGFGKIIFNSASTNPNGLTQTDREFKKQRALKLKAYLQSKKELFEANYKRHLEFLGSIFSYAKSSMRKSVATSYDQKQYMNAAWWYKNIANDIKSHDRILTERYWIMALPYLVFGALVLAAILLVIRHKRKKN